MGKRSSGAFERFPKDYYITPREAVLPLLPQLPSRTVFAEPCAGNGALIDILASEGHRCVWATDTAPAREDVTSADATTLHGVKADMFITNPPWTRNILHPIIAHLSTLLPCWFLFDADWAHTRQSAELIGRCSKIVPVGRIKWIPGSAHVGKDNCCWYEFLPGHTIGPRFIGRQLARKGHGAVEAGAVPLVQSTVDFQPQTASDVGPLADSIERVSPSSALLARLRQGLRPMVLPRVTPGEVEG